MFESSFPFCPSSRDSPLSSGLFEKSTKKARLLCQGMSNSLFLRVFVILVYLRYYLFYLPLLQKSMPLSVFPSQYSEYQYLRILIHSWEFRFFNPSPHGTSQFWCTIFYLHMFHIFHSAFLDKSNNPTTRLACLQVFCILRLPFFGAFSEVMTPLRKPHWLSQFAAVLKKSQEHSGHPRNVLFQKRPNQTFKTIKPIAIKHVQTPSNEHDSWQHLEHVVSLHTLSLYIILPIVPIVLALLSFIQHPSGDFYVSGSDFSSVSMSCFQISISWLTFFACDTLSQDIPPRQSNLLNQIIKWSNMKQYFGPQSELNCQLTSTKTKTCPE